MNRICILKDRDSNIVGFHSIRARKMGPDLLVDLQLQVNPRISVSMSHQVSVFLLFLEPSRWACTLIKRLFYFVLLILFILLVTQITENLRHALYEEIHGLTEALIHVDVEEVILY
jgi:hypothetical protein